MVRVILCVAVLFLASLAPIGARAAEPPKPDAKGIDLFDKQIKPVLVKHCYECHSKDAEEIGGGLELDSPSGMLRGGDSGPMLVAHQAKKSALLRMLRHEEGVEAMPPEHKLPDEVVAAFAEWIRLGAPDSREDTAVTAKAERLAAGQRHWAFQPPKSVEPPAVKQADWPRHAIDRFVLASMEAKGLKPVADANRRTLVRRIYFDLIGLPPSPQDVDAFVADKSPDATAKLVDKLLASPQFGERWGRHWLDVVRFAESSGMEFNFTYPHAWPYRNYVIDAFNQDKPYDQFLREQLAGDLLPPPKDESPEALEARRIAPSILAFGPKRHNSSGTDYQMNIADDQINTVTRSMLALTVACARCHDHKFDPVSTQEYYALAGIFVSTEPLCGTIRQKYSNNPTDLLPIGPNAAALHAAAEAHDKQLAESEKTLTAKREELKKATESEKQGVIKGEVASLEAKLAELKKKAPKRPQYAMTVRDRAKPADTKLAIRGEFRTRGDVVPRGFLSAVKVPNASPVNAKQSGRLELAQWMTSPDNPVTPRVMVNRIWHHLFGRGIVPTVDNFGMIGKPPTHPELLDALALQFVKDGWSVKRMIRTIMLTRAYQLNSTPDVANMKVDPGNRLLWRATPRRLEAETIRDAVLAVSGQLNSEPPVGSTVTGLGDQLVRGIKTEKIQPPSTHRSVYLPVVRDYVPEIFDLFDFPSPSLVSGRRAVTNVPSQALYLRNSKFVAEHAQHAAKRLLASKEATDDASRVELAMRWSLGRGPTDAERAGALELVQQTRQAPPKDADPEVSAYSAWFLTLFTTAEFRFLVDIN